MIKVTIVEDEKENQDMLKDYLARYGKENNLEFQIKVYTNGMNFVEEYKTPADIIFMDIEMPLMNGMTAAEHLRKVDENVCIIFITHLAKYALKGYGVNALSYLLKPLSYEQFARVADRAVSKMKRNTASVVLKRQEGLKVINVSDIYYVESENYLVVYHTAEGEFKETNTLKKLEEVLPSETFAMCNRCYLVNLDYVTNVTQNMVNVNGTVLQISRNKKKDFVNALTKHVANDK